MVRNTIESNTLIDAPMETVWKLVAEPAFWVADRDMVSGRMAQPGEELIVENPIVGRVVVKTEEVSAPTRVSYRWNSAFPGQEDLRPDNSTLVVFTLEDAGQQTRVAVVESGFANLVGPDQLRSNAVSFNTEGWSITFAGLAERAVGATGG